MLQPTKSQYSRSNNEWQYIHKGILLAVIQGLGTGKAIFDFVKGYCGKLSPKISQIEVDYFLAEFEIKGVVKLKEDRTYEIV